jgi:hypothetical protein
MNNRNPQTPFQETARDSCFIMSPDLLFVSVVQRVKQIVAIAPCSTLNAMHAKTFYVLAIHATHRALFYTDRKEALKDVALREGDRPTGRD